MAASRPDEPAGPQMASDGFLDLAGADAAGAHIFPYGPAVFKHLYLLDVGVPHLLGLLVGVADIIANLYRFAANFTFSHGSVLQTRDDKGEITIRVSPPALNYNLA
jgi:hypothetical protein